MLTESPDILHGVIRVAYKCFIHKKVAKVSLITELERVLYKQKNPCLCKKIVKLSYYDFVFAIRAYYL